MDRDFEPVQAVETTAADAADPVELEPSAMIEPPLMLTDVMCGLACQVKAEHSMG